MKKIFGFLALLILCNSAFAQEKNVSLDLKDAPVRTCLEMAFKQADINNFVIEAGFEIVNAGQDGHVSFISESINSTHQFYTSNEKGKEELWEICAVKK